jgi:3-oxoacyl-[acyl-carrier protein] reductase
MSQEQTSTDPQNTADRTAIVTGGSRGIGKAIAIALGSRGYKVVVNYFSRADAAQETAGLVRDAGGQALTVQADVGRAPDRSALIEKTLAEFGGIDLLVNNAGIPPAQRTDLLDATEESYDRVMDTNLKGPFFLTQLAARHMVSAKSGTIINIGSVSSYAATPKRSQYCIAKAGMTMMTQLYAADLAPHGIGVFEICPGVINTDMARNAKEKYDTLINEQDLLPIARWGQPDDVAKAVAAIVDGYFPYSTGTVIDVDGGYHIRRL